MGNQQVDVQHHIFMEGLDINNLSYAKKVLGTQEHLNNFVHGLHLGISDHMANSNRSEAVTKKLRREIYAEYKKLPTPQGFTTPPYPNTKGEYLINKDGILINKKTRAIMSTHISTKGYEIANISYVRDDNTIVKVEPLHRIVAKTFIPNPENKPQVNHKDGNKLNNSVTNLEWCTNAENRIHAIQTGLYENASINIRGENQWKAKLTNKQADDIRMEYGICHISTTELAVKYNVSKSTIKKIVSGKTYNKYDY